MTSRRPLSVTALALLFVMAGVLGMAHHGAQLARSGCCNGSAAVAVAVRVAMTVSGVLALYGVGWSRWALTALAAYFLVSADLRSPMAVVFHAVLLGATARILFSESATAFFRRRA
jgi:hypothetical protein